MKKRVIRTIFIITVLLTVGYVIFSFTMSSNSNDSNSIERLSVSIIETKSSLVTDLHNREKNEIGVVFELSSISTSEYDFDVILLANYSQKEFSINGEEANFVQHINVPKSEEVISKEISISFDDISNNMLDCVLLFKPIPKEERENFSPRYYSKRFVAKVDEEKYDIKIEKQISDLSVLEEKVLFAPMVKDKEGNLILENKRMSEILKFNKNDVKDIFLFSNISELIDTNRFNGFVNVDENITHEAIIFVISNNKLIAAIDDKKFSIYDIYSKNRNILKVSLDTKSIDDECTIFLMNYPFENYEKKLGTYEMVLWDTVLSIPNINK